jgi:hypothetical protein
VKILRKYFDEEQWEEVSVEEATRTLKNFYQDPSLLFTPGNTFTTTGAEYRVVA